jgi:ribosomal protein RSM22 (predicted rRNA methylase)
VTLASLPPELTAALDLKLEGFSRSEAAAHAARISETYRAGGTSTAIRSEADAIAYAAVRMPATYAALTASFKALQQVVPNLLPDSLIDVGAGPGTATWAAAEAFPALTRFTLIDSNEVLRRLALDLARASARFRELTYLHGEARAMLAAAEPADVVIANYVIGEFTDSERGDVGELMWTKTRRTLLIVEPGTPAGYARIMGMRERLIALGAHVAAPCPHDRPCPLAPPDWCHFTQRLARSRAHKQIKHADVPFEDEKFAYVALTLSPPPRRFRRLLTQPTFGKGGISAKLCAPDGLVVQQVPRREKTAYAHARRWRWGDALIHED